MKKKSRQLRSGSNRKTCTFMMYFQTGLHRSLLVEATDKLPAVVVVGVLAVVEPSATVHIDGEGGGHCNKKEVEEDCARGRAREYLFMGSRYLVPAPCPFRNPRWGGQQVWVVQSNAF